MCPKLRCFKLIPWLLRGEEYSIAGESPGSGAGQPGREAHLSHSPGNGEAAGPLSALIEAPPCTSGEVGS